MSSYNNPHTEQAKIEELTRSRLWAAPTRELKHHNRGKLGQWLHWKNEIPSGGLDVLIENNCELELQLWHGKSKTKQGRP
jgi:hypothetical protein